MTRGKRDGLRAPRLSSAERAGFAAHAARLVPVTYAVVAGPPGSPATMLEHEDPERMARRRV